MRTWREGSVPSHIIIANWRDFWHPEGGGSELYALQVAQRLRAAGTRVTWVTAAYPGAARDEEIDGIRYVRRGGHISVYLWTAWLFLSGRLGRHDAVLEVQNGMPFLTTWLTRARVVVLVHHVHREQWSVVGPLLAKFGWFMESRVAVRANRGNRYLAVSDVTRRELVELGVRADDVRLAYNGLPPAPEYSVRPRTDDPRLLVLSRLVPHKRIEHAIDCLVALSPEFPGLTLTVMGDGWWRENLEQYARELGVADRVDFRGHVDEVEKFEELSAGWVHLLPSVKEGWGLSIMEAARVGVPSIAYAAAGGVAESILDGVTGLLAYDETDLVARTRELLTDRRLAEEMGEKARMRSGEFTWDHTTKQVAAALFES